MLVTPGDVPQLSAALLRLVGDAGTAAAMGEAARAVACSRFDEQESVARYRALFDEVASRRRG